MTDSEPMKMDYIGGTTDTKMWAIGAILAAIYGVGSLMPVSGFIAAPGVVATISLTLVIAPLFGLLLGPYKGAGFGLVAGLIAAALTGSGGLYLVVPTTIFGPAISGLFTGLIMRHDVDAFDTRMGGILTAAYLAVIVILYNALNSKFLWVPA